MKFDLFLLFINLSFNFTHIFFFLQDLKDADDTASTFRNSENSQLVQIQKKDNIIEKSIDKLKETGTV